MKWILRYLKGSSRICLCFRGPKLIMEGYVDIEMAGDLDGRNYFWIFVYFCRGAVFWQSILQKCVALSTTEAKYVAMIEVGKEMLWLKIFLQQLRMK